MLLSWMLDLTLLREYHWYHSVELINIAEYISWILSEAWQQVHCKKEIFWKASVMIPFPIHNQGRKQKVWQKTHWISAQRHDLCLYMDDRLSHEGDCKLFLIW